jgi:hypothetical protein
MVTAPVIPPAGDRMTRTIVVGLLVTFTLVALQAVSQLIDFSVFNLRLRAFNSDKHDSVFGLASLLAQMAVAAASVWRGRRVERHRRAWFALGALVTGLVLVRGLTAFNAAVVAAPLACVFWLVCWLTWRDRGAVRAVVWAGLILMVISLVLHKVGLAADASNASDYTWAYQLTGVVKHGCELAGWMLVATGIAAGLQSGDVWSSDDTHRIVTGERWREVDAGQGGTDSPPPRVHGSIDTAVRSRHATDAVHVRTAPATKRAVGRGHE